MHIGAKYYSRLFLLVMKNVPLVVASLNPVWEICELKSIIPWLAYYTTESSIYQLVGMEGQQIQFPS